MLVARERRLSKRGRPLRYRPKKRKKTRQAGPAASAVLFTFSSDIPRVLFLLFPHEVLGPRAVDHERNPIGVRDHLTFYIEWRASNNSPPEDRPTRSQVVLRLYVCRTRSVEPYPFLTI